jgi:hypothetical protein
VEGLKISSLHGDYNDCDIIGAHFPLIGKCCKERTGMFGPEYESVCPFCSAMTFPLNSTSLEIVSYFECSRLGYSKRTTDAQSLGTDSCPEKPRE